MGKDRGGGEGGACIGDLRRQGNRVSQPISVVHSGS